jgi:hypothetical protein
MLIIFQHFQVVFRQLYKTNGKYGVTVYFLTYQRPFQFFVIFFSKNMFDYGNMSQKTVKMLLMSQINVDIRSFVR